MSAIGSVSVCIPTYQAEEFIDRTLRCARGQTHPDLEILVAVDLSTDATEEICRAHAAEDPRVTVTAHHRRQGWVHNVNHLLDTASGDYGFVYFHDDVIEPTYVERLVGVLVQDPQAASAHCDVVMDNVATGTERLRPGFTYRGTAVERLLANFVAPERGELLRAVVRRSGPAGALRMPVAAALYEMELVASGDAIAVHEPLYRRYNERPGGMTTGWARRPFDEVLRGVRGNAASARQLVARVARTPGEVQLLEMGMAVYFSRRLRNLEQANGVDRVVALSEVGLPEALALPPGDAELPAELRDLCATSVERVARWTANRRREVQGG